MRVGFVTQWFPPEPGTVVPAAIATGLTALGHDVEVLTGFPNYPTGKVMPGYRVRPYQRDTGPGGVPVHRAPLYPSHSSSAAARMANYVSFAVGGAVVGRGAIGRPDVWLVYSSPATAAIPAARLLRRHQAPIFLLIQDLWPDSVTGSGFVEGAPGRAVERGLTSFCDWTYRQAAGIGVISPGMRDVLVARGVPDSKIFDTPNWIDDDHLLPAASPGDVDRNALGIPAGRVWMYAGNMGELQGLDALVTAFAQRPAAQLVMLGDGVARERLTARATELGASNIRFLPQAPLDQVGRFIAASDIQVVSLQDTPLLRATMPSKVQTSLASARPVLAHAAGDAAAVVTEAGAGWAAAPGDLGSTLRAIDDGLSATDSDLADMGRRSRAAFESRYSNDAGPSRLALALEGSINRSRRD